jgi:hypothetical protein
MELGLSSEKDTYSPVLTIATPSGGTSLSNVFNFFRLTAYLKMGYAITQEHLHPFLSTKIIINFSTMACKAYIKENGLF